MIWDSKEVKSAGHMRIAELISALTKPTIFTADFFQSILPTIFCPCVKTRSNIHNVVCSGTLPFFCFLCYTCITIFLSCITYVSTLAVSVNVTGNWWNYAYLCAPDVRLREYQSLQEHNLYLSYVKKIYNLKKYIHLAECCNCNMAL